MKTIIIRVQDGSLTHVLRSFYKNKVKCEFVGLDQNDKILMQLSYKEDQSNLIKNTIKYIALCTELLKEISKTVYNESQKDLRRFNKLVKEVAKYHSAIK